MASHSAREARELAAKARKGEADQRRQAAAQKKTEAETRRQAAASDAAAKKTAFEQVKAAKPQERTLGEDDDVDSESEDFEIGATDLVLLAARVILCRRADGRRAHAIFSWCWGGVTALAACLSVAPFSSSQAWPLR